MLLSPALERAARRNRVRLIGLLLSRLFTMEHSHAARPHLARQG